MMTSGVRHLPVVADGEVRGMLSDRDVLAAGRKWLHEGATERQPVMLVHDAMSTRLSTTTPDRPAPEAATTLLRRRVGALPVLRGARAAGYAHRERLPLLDPGAGLTQSRRNNGT